MARTVGGWRLATLFVLAALTFSSPAPVRAEESAPVPILVVRFNQPQVNFQKHLATLVERARNLKPDVSFYLVNYVPPDAPPMDAMPTEVSQIGNALIRLGVPKTNITYDRIYANVRTSEVHVFLK